MRRRRPYFGKINWSVRARPQRTRAWGRRPTRESGLLRMPRQTDPYRGSHRGIRSGSIPPIKRAGLTCGKNVALGPSVISQELFAFAILLTCPPLRIGLPSPWRPQLRRCLMVTLVPRVLTTLLYPPLCPRRKWIGALNPKLTCPLAPLAYRKKFPNAADALQLSAALRGYIHASRTSFSP